MRYLFSVIITLLTSFGSLSFAAAAKGSASPQTTNRQLPADYLSVTIGHQSKQTVSLYQRKSTNKTVTYVVSYKTEDAGFERAIPKSLYTQYEAEFRQIEKKLLGGATVINYQCPVPLEISKPSGNYTVCDELINKKELRALDKWFLTNKDLALGSLENYK